jgi:spermidine/putrescine transport system substrate-binding protein
MPRNPYSRRLFLQQSVAAASGLALSGCGWRLADVRPVAPSGDSNKLYLYTWAGYTDRALLQRFTQETGIEVVADVFDSNEVMLAKLQSGGGGVYSIIYPSDYMVRRMRDLRLLVPLDHDRLDGLDRLFEPYQNPAYDPGNQYSIPISWGTTGLVYNQARLGSDPNDWEYLWENRSRLARRLTLLNDPRETMGAALRRLGYSYNATDPEEIRRAYEALRELRPAIASFTTDAWRDRVVAGDLYAAMSYSADAVGVEEENPDLRYAIPRSGTSLWTDTMAIPITAPNPDGAYAWLNFLLKPDVAASVTETLAFATPNRVAYDLLPPDLAENPSLFPSQEILAKCESVSPVGEATALYNRYWTLLTSA